MGHLRLFPLAIVGILVSYISRVAAHDIPRERIQVLCPDLLYRGFVDFDNASWQACGQGAFHESRDVTLDILDVTSVVYDGQQWPEPLAASCQGTVSLANPRIVKACQSTVDSRDVFAILRAQIVCTDGDGDRDGDGYWGSDEDDDWGFDEDYDDHDCGDDYFCLFQESGPLVLDALWGMEIDISSGQFRLEDLCIREVPIVPKAE